MTHQNPSPLGYMISAFLLGLVYIALGVPLALRKIAPNGLYGFRVNKTLNDPKTWYEANAYAGRAFIWSGTATALLALCIPYVASHIVKGPRVLGVFALAVELVPMLVGVVAAFVYLSRL